MLSKLPALLRVPLALLAVASSTLLHCVVLFAAAVLKLLLPLEAARRALSRVLVVVAESWIAVNSALMDVFTPTRWRIEGLEGLSYQGWYLVLANHQSWVDIPVLQRVFNRRIPFLKFFLKQQLIWVPVLGLAWWALDFPFMRRYSRETLERHPELRGKDREATRRACARFRRLPVSVMNFVEGTRFTPQKHAEQDSPYPDLLRPKAGGVAFVLDAMGDILQGVVDVTIAYPHGRPTVGDLFAGRIPEVRVVIRQRPLPAELLHGDYDQDQDFRARFQDWVNTLWNEKQAVLDALLQRPDTSLHDARPPGPQH